MNISNYYWYFQSAVPERICDLIVKYGKQEKKREVTAITGGLGRDRDLNKHPLTKEELKDLKKKRDSNVMWMNDPWIYKEIHPYIHTANKNANWNFEWNFTEPAQFTIYKKDQHYNWHIDPWDAPYNAPRDPHRHGKIRKLSVTLTLSDEKDYKGGELEFNLGKNIPGKKKNTVIPKDIGDKGTLIVFPSHIPHRVRPVTKGTRHSLVMWALGYPFK